MLLFLSSSARSLGGVQGESCCCFAELKGTGVRSGSLDSGLGRVGEEQITCALFVFEEGFGTFDAFLYRHFKRVLLTLALVGQNLSFLKYI